MELEQRIDDLEKQLAALRYELDALREVISLHIWRISGLDKPPPEPLVIHARTTG